MQPMGRKPSRFPSKTDHHILKTKNWWEDDMCSENKVAERTTWKQEVNQELLEEDE